MERANQRQPQPLEEQVAEFERQNPKVAKAMKLFGMSLAKYQGALHAMHAPRITQGNSTRPTQGGPRLNG